MPYLNGIEATRQIAKRAPHIRLIMVSMHADEAYVVQAIQAGAHGYLLKDSADTDLVQAVSDPRRWEVVLQSRRRQRHAR